MKKWRTLAPWFVVVVWVPMHWIIMSDAHEFFRAAAALVLVFAGLFAGYVVGYSSRKLSCNVPDEWKDWEPDDGEIGGSGDGSVGDS